MYSDLTTQSARFEFMEESGFFEYGTTIPTSTIYKIFGIAEVEYPATKAEITTAQMAELQATDYIRSRLLDQGKYLKGEKDSYRVLLPSENAGQVLSYMRSADGKLQRAFKLNANTPSDYKISSNDEVRLYMKTS